MFLFKLNFKKSFVKVSTKKVTNISIPPIPEGAFRGTESEIPKGGWRKIPSGQFQGSESEIPKGGWRSERPVRDIYRTNSGCYFEFEFHKMSDSYDIDIISMPPYPASMKSDFHKTHRLNSRNGNVYRVCLADNSVANSLENSKKWAGVWAEHTVKLIEGGKNFPNV